MQLLISVKIIRIKLTIQIRLSAVGDRIKRICTGVVFLQKSLLGHSIALLSDVATAVSGVPSDITRGKL